MNKKIKVSLILPSLNVVTYIKECIESVINQSLHEIEIICVDAGSTDGTLEILREYKKKDSRIRIVISDRKSYGYQMNIGIESASGEYIGIVETDDYVLGEMYEELYSIAKINRADFVKADFYRFTGKAGELDKILFRLSKDCSFYNRLINIGEEQECFKFPMNTWSGIYNRSFLLKHNIVHNETPGASFQDNGFWFQTFMHAKKAYFTNKPYYMNRRDNPNSSVYNKNKMYCVCDEYQFIENILREDKELFEKYKYIFSYICFQSYKGNLIKIRYNDQKEYLQRFSEKFRLLHEQKMLNYHMFSDSDEKTLRCIINNPEKYFNQKSLPKQKIFDIVRNYKSIIIYGAGAVGKRVLNEVRWQASLENVMCFAVSEKRENDESYQGISIYDIHDLVGHREECLVIIAVSKLYQDEIYNTLRDLGFMHVIVIP